MRERWGVLISGNGSTLQSLIDCRDHLDLSVVIASKSAAYGIARARRAGVPVEVIPAEFKGVAGRAGAEKWVAEKLTAYNVQKIFLAGYMKIVSAEFIKNFEGKIFNIHPSLLPKHKGLDGFGDALKAGDSHAGVSIHHVVPDMDSGKIVMQNKFEIPDHRDDGLSRLWLHIQEQRAMREMLTRSRWEGSRQSLMAPLSEERAW